MPSGLAYAVAARPTVRELLPVESPPADLSTACGELALALSDAALDGVQEPSLGAKTSGYDA